MNEHQRNILNMYNLIDGVDRQHGLNAYQRYQDLLRKIAEEYDVGYVQCVAAFASLSPNNDYIGNLRSLVACIKGIKNNTPDNLITVATYNHCKNRALSYLRGDTDFLVKTKGPKIKNFYMNILKPEDPKYITIDGHMYSLWRGERMAVKKATQLGWDNAYDKVATDFKRIAKLKGLLPNQLQAMLWFTWKRVHNIKFDSQFSLFHLDDPWRLNIDIDQIKEYT